MRHEILECVKKEITEKLSSYLRDEGFTLYIAANDVAHPEKVAVVLEAIEHYSLPSHKPISEIRVILGVLGKPWQCDTLIEGIYQCLQPHKLTLTELTVLLMSMHIDSVRRIRTSQRYKKAALRYIMEEALEEEIM